MKKNLEDAIARWRNNKKEKETRIVSAQGSQPPIGEFEIDIKISNQDSDTHPGDATSVSARMKTTTQSVAGDIVPDADVLLFEQTVNKLENEFYKRNNPAIERPAKRTNPGESKLIPGISSE